MESETMARDYEFKLNSLRLLKQALDSHLITWAQYNSKQEEFLNVVKFTPPEVSLDTTSLVAIKVQQMEDDLERGTKRPAGCIVERPRKMSKMNSLSYPEEQLSSLEMLCRASYCSSYEPYLEVCCPTPKYATFSEFMYLYEFENGYDAVRALGGTALLQTIYKYAYDHRNDIDSKYAYRFRDNEYKSNVRSTLHNTGAFSKTPTGEWTITGKLKSRR